MSKGIVTDIKQRMGEQRKDHEILTQALPKFVNLQNAYFLMQEDPWRDHGQSPVVRQQLLDWKPARRYDDWGTTKLMPTSPRLIFWLEPVRYLAGLRCSSGSRLRSLVISGYQCGTAFTDRNFVMTNDEMQVFSSLRTLTIDFRLMHGYRNDVANSTSVPRTLRAMLAAATLLESFDLFLTGTQLDLGFEIFGDTEVYHGKVDRICVCGVKFDEAALSAFIGRYRGTLRHLIITNPNFVHSLAWTTYILSLDSDIEEAASRSDVTPVTAGTKNQKIPEQDAGRFHHIKWKEGHVFAEGDGVYDRTRDRLDIEWQVSR
jgi:hypothetical protein